MSEIVNFPANTQAEQRRLAREERQRTLDERARKEAETLEKRRALLDHARAAREKRPKMVRETERRRVASNLWELLDQFEMKPGGPSKADVLRESGISRQGDSTKRLPRFALKPGGKGKGLTKGVKTYVKIARKAAELAGEDQDDAELEILKGSSYLSDLSAIPIKSPDGRVAEIIAKGLMDVAARLDEKHGLRSYFDQCERQRLVPSEPGLDAPSFAVGSDSSFKNLPLDSDVPIDKSIWRCPRTYLGSVIAGPPVLVSARASMRYDGDLEDDWDPEGGRAVSDSERYFQHDLQVKCIPTFDIYIALSPSGAAGSTIPVLITSPVTRVKPASFFREGSLGSAIFDDRFTLGEYSGFPSPMTRQHKSRLNLISLSNDYVHEVETDRELVTPTLEADLYRPKNCFLLPRSSPGWVVQKLIVGHGKIPDQARPSSRELSIILVAASAENILNFLTKYMFFRHHESSHQDASPTGWTDERQREKGDFYFRPASEAQDDAQPTVASARTLLARLERWMRGDLVIPDGAGLVPGRLEDELDRCAEILVGASKSAMENAGKRLHEILVEPLKEPSADAEPIPDQT
jgi:hypothetical protein